MKHSHSPSKSRNPAERRPSPEEQKADAPVPYVGKPLDGSQYHDVVEEQIYADQRPSQEEQRPIRSRKQGD